MVVRHRDRRPRRARPRRLRPGLAPGFGDRQGMSRRREVPQPLKGIIPAVRDAAHACITGLGSDRKEDVGEATARKLARSLLDEVHDTAVRLLEAFDDDLAHQRDVVWLTGDRYAASPRPPALKVAPLGVAGLLRERVFNQHTTILTSATLTLGGTFDTMARQWGLPPGPVQVEKAPGTATDKEPPSDAETGPKWTGLDVGSPFDHQRHGIPHPAKPPPPPRPH